MIYPQGGFGPFLSTPSARRATAGRHGSSATVAISIHALREEGDPPSSKSGRPSANFYPRPPRGGRLFCAARAASSRVFLSTPSARRATRAGEPFLLLPEISIHALREEGDVSVDSGPSFASEFLSTPSARRATQLVVIADLLHLFLSTPSARRATLSPCAALLLRLEFLSTPSARRATQHLLSCTLQHVVFLSTPSARRATPPSASLLGHFCISIHALREEGDRRDIVGADDHNDFYPRPPRGGRRCRQRRSAFLVKFLSTPSARRATSRRSRS